MGKVIPFEHLKTIRQRQSEKVIVQCHGVFDLFHHGHLLHLVSARKHGDLLVVTITPDRFVNKGPGRPRFTQEQRADLLAALSVVDYVCINHYPKAVEAIWELRPNFYAKGADYQNAQADITGAILEENDAVQSVGGKLVFTQDPMASSSQLINEFFSTWDDHQKRAIQEICTSIGLTGSLRIVNELEHLRVLVVGEPIVDTYVFCRAEGISTKSPTVSANYEYEEDYAGGSLAIANHLAALGCDVSVIITHGGEDYFRDLLHQRMHKRVKIIDLVLKDVPTPRKIRYLVPFRSQRLFELQNVTNDQWQHCLASDFIRLLEENERKADVVIIADFGHGLFEGSVIDAVSKIRAFLGLNAQTNSGNFGFNPFTKHSRYDYLCIDEKECRVATHDRCTPIKVLGPRVARMNGNRKIAITLGTEGSSYHDGEGRSYWCPAFFKDVIDTTGAGDAFFALTTLLAYRQLPGFVIPFLGNCYAGLKTRILGNKHPVSKIDFLKTITALLK